jgi:hypothetical protein
MEPGETRNIQIPVKVTSAFVESGSGKFRRHFYLADKPTPPPGQFPKFDDITRGDNVSLVEAPVLPWAYDVTFTLDKIKVRDDCDSVSPGDWKILFQVFEQPAGAAAPTRAAHVCAPSCGGIPFNISSGDTKQLGKAITMQGVKHDSSISLEVEPVDCDDGFSTEVDRRGARGGPVGVSIGVLDCSNSDEEVQESSGNDDRAGLYSIGYGPAAWHDGVAFGGWSGAGDCGNQAFAPSGNITVSPNYSVPPGGITIRVPGE